MLRLLFRLPQHFSRGSNLVYLLERLATRAGSAYLTLRLKMLDIMREFARPIYLRSTPILRYLFLKSNTNALVVNVEHQ